MTDRFAGQASEAPVLAEDQARAGFYGLIARLFFAGADAALLAAIAAADDIAGEDPDAPLPAAWRALVAATAAMDAEAAREEYDNVFVGTGMAEITPYSSHYLAESMQERVLVRLREKLNQMGLAKNQSATEYEDHYSGLCEVMRRLIAEGSSDAAVQEQKAFFMEYIAPGYAKFLAAIMASPNTNYYKKVAGFTKAFFDVERDSFELF